MDCCVVHPELHKKFDEVLQDESKVNEAKKIVEAAAATTKVLPSGKVLGNSPSNNAKQEWMQKRQNMYQMDKRDHIIDGAKDDGVVKGKENNKEDVVVTKI